MEYADSGDLQQVITRVGQGIKINEKVLWGYCQQVLSALQYMHNKGVVHRDIKGLNVFM